MINTVLVMGGGSAGFLAALTLKIRLPQLAVSVLRSKDLGIIQVGEGTTTTFGYHLHQYCGLDLKTFYRLAQPQWKLGIRFEWGPRPYFNYGFGQEINTRYNVLPRQTGYYLDNNDPFEATGPVSEMMNENKVWLRRPDGSPNIHPEEFTYHLENAKLVAYFEAMALERGITIIDDTAVEVLQDEHGVTGLRLKTGGMLGADLYVDASGFRSELLGKALKEPFYSYKDSLFCDRAVVGGWDRTDEPIKPYTTAETMNAGWCWQIEHEHRINRGYVFSSSFLSDEDAEAEMRAKNPKLQDTRIVPFRSGRYERIWVKNVVGIGNASAFVEPLEATALATICIQCQALTEFLADSGLEPNRATYLVFNRQLARGFDSVRDFLALHYRFNRRLDTPFWHECLTKAELHGARRPVEFYEENGPSALWRDIIYEENDQREFGTEGYLAMLVGQAVPHRSPYKPSPDDRRAWASVQRWIRARVATAYTVPEALALVRSDSWVWPDRLYNRSHTLRR
jgi:tryptophan 7-halogenase